MGELLRVMVADYIFISARSTGRSFPTGGKALVAPGHRRYLLRREQGIYLTRDERRVYHYPLCTAGVDVHAAYLPARRGGVEGLIVYLAYLVAVDGVGKVRAEALKVETAPPRCLSPRRA